MKINKLKLFSAGIIIIISFLAIFYYDPTAKAAVTCTGDFMDVGGTCVPTTAAIGLSGGPDDATSISSILTSVLNWLLGIIGIISMIMFVVSGFQYLTAGGDEKEVETAKRNIKYSIIGLAIALTSFLVIETIDYVIKRPPNLY